MWNNFSFQYLFPEVCKIISLNKGYIIIYVQKKIHNFLCVFDNWGKNLSHKKK